MNVHKEAMMFMKLSYFYGLTARVFPKLHFERL